MYYEKKDEHVISFKPSEPKEVDLLKQDIGTLLLESANDKAKIAELENLTGDLILEIANLKAGGAT